MAGGILQRSSRDRFCPNFAGYFSLLLTFDPLYAAGVSDTVTKWANKKYGKTSTHQRCNILLLACMQWKWGSSLRIASRVRQDSRGIVCPFPAREKEFTVLHTFMLSLGPTKLSIEFYIYLTNICRVVDFDIFSPFFTPTCFDA